MNRALFTLAMVAGIAISSSAELVCEEFRGTKANNSDVNPCKGSTTRVCAKRWRNIQTLQGLQTGVQIKETVYDGNGNRISSSSYQIMNATPSSVIADMERMLPYNATMYVVPDDEMPDSDE